MEEMENDFLEDLVGHSEEEEQIEDTPQQEQLEEEHEEVQSEESELYEAYDVIKSFGIADGMVQYGDEKLHISELSYDEQMDIIGQLREQELERMSNIPEFDDNEMQVLKHAAENGYTLNEYIDAIREQDRLKYEKEMESIIAQIKLETTLPVVEDLSDDEIMLVHLKRTLGEGTSMEEIQEALEERKSLKTYGKEVGKLRTQLINEQESYKEQLLQQDQIQNEEYVKEFQSRAAESIVKLDSIAGFDVDKNEKQYLFEKIAQVDEGYDTFITKHFVHDPIMQAKAVWFLEHEPEISDYISELESKIKSAYNDGYNKGKNDLIKNKYPSTTQKPVVTQPSIKSEGNILDTLY